MSVPSMTVSLLVLGLSGVFVFVPLAFLGALGGADVPDTHKCNAPCHEPYTFSSFLFIILHISGNSPCPFIDLWIRSPIEPDQPSSDPLCPCPSHWYDPKWLCHTLEHLRKPSLPSPL